MDLYRFYDADDALLYVGISLNAATRASQHRKDKSWWPDVTRMEIEHLATDIRSEAEAYERSVIVAESPRYNIVHNASQQRANDALVLLCDVCGEPVPDGGGWLSVLRDEVSRFERFHAELRSIPVGPGLKSPSLAELLSGPREAKWHVFHADCDPDVEAASYHMAVERCRTPRDLLRWNAHMIDKRWITSTDWGDFLERIVDQRVASREAAA